MRLVRGFQTNGTCKYALVRLDKMRKDGVFKSIQHFLDKYPELQKYVEFGQPGSKEEFFVFKFKDLASTAVLKKASEEYSRLGDEEFSNEILGLLDRTGENHPNCKQADTDPSSYILEDINNPISTQTHTDTCTNFGFSVDVNTHTPEKSTDSKKPITGNTKILDKLFSSINLLKRHKCLDESIVSKLKDIYIRAYAPSLLFVEENFEREYKNTWAAKNISEDNWNCL